MKVALDNLAGMEAARKVAILGDMLELGADSTTEHARVLEQLRHLHLDDVLLIGPEFGKVAGNGTFRHFINSEAAGSWLVDHPFKDACILIKGSRGIGLERILDME